MKHGESGVLQIVDMTGEKLLRTLEYAIPADNDIRGWFYYFSGLKMTYAPSAIPGKRIIKITDAEGKPLEAQRVYTAAVMDQTFPEDAIQSLTDTGISIQALLTETIQSRKTITPGKDGRFIIREPAPRGTAVSPPTRDLPNLEKANGQGEDPLAIQHVDVYAVSYASEDGMNF